jgi:hypothetical protein
VAPNRLYVWDRLEPREQILIEPLDLLAVAIRRAGGRHVERDETAGVEPGVARLQAHQVLHEQAGTDEKTEGNRDLRDDETAADAPPGLAARARIPFPDPLRQRPRPQAQHGPQSAPDAGDDRQLERERQHRSVDAERVCPRKRVARQTNERRDRPTRQRQTDGAARQREQQGEQREDRHAAAAAEHPPSVSNVAPEAGHAPLDEKGSLVEVCGIADLKVRATYGDELPTYGNPLAPED